MSDLRDLYQTMILDHSKKPRNAGRPPHANRSARGDNPLCGDKLDLHLALDAEGVIREVGFEGSGCAISTASASIMTECVKGRSAAEVREIFERFHELVTGERKADPAELGKLAVFAGVRGFPLRVKCATLGWHTLRAALEGDPEIVTTE